MKRREFIQQAAVISTTAVSYSRVVGANDRVVIGLIGCGGRGRQVAELMRKVHGVEYGAVCDVYEANAASAQIWAGSAAKKFGDFRKLLELKEVDVVHVATPDHWQRRLRGKTAGAQRPRRPVDGRSRAPLQTHRSNRHSTSFSAALP
jgi:hypothetical protein